MKTLRPPRMCDYPDGTKGYYCRPCGEYWPLSFFYPSVIERRDTRCKKCHQAYTRKSRRADRPRAMLRSLRVRIRRRNDPDEKELARAWEVEDVHEVMRRYGYEEPYPLGLCLVRIDDNKHATPDNVWPMKTRVAQGRHHLQRVRQPPRARSKASKRAALRAAQRLEDAKVVAAAWKEAEKAAEAGK